MKKPLVALVALSLLFTGCAATDPAPVESSSSAAVEVLEITDTSSLAEMIAYAEQITPGAPDVRERVRKAAQSLQDAHDLPWPTTNEVNQDLTSLNADTFDGEPVELVNELRRIVLVIKDSQ